MDSHTLLHLKGYQEKPGGKKQKREREKPGKDREEGGPFILFTFSLLSQTTRRSKRGNGLFCHVFRGPGPGLASRTTAERGACLHEKWVWASTSQSVFQGWTATTTLHQTSPTSRGTSVKVQEPVRDTSKDNLHTVCRNVDLVTMQTVSSTENRKWNLNMIHIFQPRRSWSQCIKRCLQ